MPREFVGFIVRKRLFAFNNNLLYKVAYKAFICGDDDLKRGVFGQW